MKLVAKRAPEVREPDPEEDPFSVFSAEDDSSSPQPSIDRSPGFWPNARYVRPVLLVVLPSVLILAGGYFAIPVLKARWASGAATARLAVSSNPAGAEILVDGVRRGVTPLTMDVAAGPHTLVLRAGSFTKELQISARAEAELLQHVEMAPPIPTAGSLTVTSDPAGLAVTVDGKPHAATPITIDGLSPGTHVVRVAGQGIRLERSVEIAAGATASLVFSRAAESTAAPGSVIVSSPIEVQLYQADVLIGSSRSARLLLPAGTHTLTAVNDALGFRRTVSVQVAPGSTVRLAIPIPNGTLNVNAQPWAQVWVDGKAMGDTPIANITLPIGTHDLLLRHPQYGEHRELVTIRAESPTRIGVDMRK